MAKNHEVLALLHHDLLLRYYSTAAEIGSINFFTRSIKRDENFSKYFTGCKNCNGQIKSE
jgi:hypothetical protein